VITAQNQQLNIELNSNDVNEDNFSFDIVDESSKGQLSNFDQLLAQ
jgi:hypothetical protein